ncbi:MAG: hypothetical protein IPG63_06210 [Xanthomonadales bacterium]|nr:hypothetical protein [Xanthomonadales bacterium]MBK7143793.1 hypothetical protein [Xanthomonadales bacterium]MCC6560274.1 hypothetical protein [Xanthomonadales bacterium]
MFGLEILLALILKFWAVLYGLVYGAISSLPRLHRSLLARQLKVEWHDAEFLIVQSQGRDLHIAGLTVIVLCSGHGRIAYRERDTLLLQGQTLRIAVDPAADALVLLGNMLDLGRGRETRLYRRIERERGVLPP